MKPDVTERDLLTRFVAEYPFQPATAFWRAIEIAVVLSRTPLEGRVLDLGCGDGRLTQILDSHWAGTRSWIGADPDPLEIEAARLRNLYVELLTCPGDAIAMPDASVDGVFSNSVLEHIPDLEPVIVESARLLRPGGRFIVTVPSDTFRECLAGSWLPWVGRGRYEKVIDRRLAHINYLSEHDWRAMLGRHGLTVRSVVPFLSLRQVRRWENLSRVTGGLLHTLFAGSTHPIRIQRKLHMRTGKERWPTSIAKALSAVISLRPQPREASSVFGCLLIEAERV